MVEFEHCVVAYAFNLSTWEAELVDLCKFKANLAYEEISRISKAVTQRTPVSGGVCGVRTRV